MSLRAYVEGLFGSVSVQLGGGKTLRRWSLAVSGVYLWREYWDMSPFLSLLSCFFEVQCCPLLCAFTVTYCLPKAQAPGPANVESAEAEQSKPPSSCCGHFVPGPGSWLRLCLVHTDLISSFSHCYRRHFMISIFLNLLRFMVYHDLFWKMTWLHLRKLYLFLYCWELYLSSNSSVPHFLIYLFSDYTWLKLRYWSFCFYCSDLSLWICSCLLLRFRHAYIWCTGHNLENGPFCQYVMFLPLHNSDWGTALQTSDKNRLISLGYYFFVLSSSSHGTLSLELKSVTYRLNIVGCYSISIHLFQLVHFCCLAPIVNYG